MIRLFWLTLLASCAFGPDPGTEGKVTPPCAAELQCSVDASGHAECAVPVPTSSACASSVARTDVTWSRVGLKVDAQSRPELVIEPLTTQTLRRSAFKNTAPIEHQLVPGKDFEVRATLFDSGGALLWSSRVYLIWKDGRFVQRVNHPAIEAASDSHRQVTFEKKDR